ncbi:hypothetical protein N8D56_17800 [Devosia sp. A8/3-2]|nr:hypothetical protein N8D56_17800 [Devosia sp. A8/3-2]
MFGTRGKALIFGLHGNPVSAMVTATVFIKPALRKWLGYAEQPSWRLPPAGPTPPNSARRHFMRAQLVHTPTGPELMPISQTDSGHTSSLSNADMLIIQPELDPGAHAGSDCRIHPDRRLLTVEPRKSRWGRQGYCGT